MKMTDEEFDLQLFSMEPIDTEIPDDDLEDAPDQGDPGDETDHVDVEGEEEDMPDDLLSPSELSERNRLRDLDAPVRETAQRDRDTDEKASLVSELRDIFGSLRQQQAPPPERERQQQTPPELQPFVLTEEQAKRITDKALSEEGGIAKLIAASVNIGEKRALARMANSNEGRAAMEASGESFADRFIARKLRDPETKFGKATEPQFQAIIDSVDLSQLASMARADRDSWFEEQWERATGRALYQKATTKAPPSAGVGRGAGTRAGAPNRGRLVVRLTDQQKKDLRASAPRMFAGEEGEKRFQRQVWEIEHGKTSDGGIRRMTADSMRFSDAAAMGGI